MNRIKTKLDIVYNENTKKDIIIVHISDIHFNINITSKRLKRISDYINKMKADYIMITGDLIDDTKVIDNKNKIKELLVFLSDIAKNTKVFIALGNHDVFKDEDYKFFNKINDLYNIYVLNNTSYQDEFIYVTGFTLPNEFYYNINGAENKEVLSDFLNSHKELINKLPNDKPKILLMHSPITVSQNDILKILHEYDLILSGHTHNGMVPDILNFLFKGNVGIISPYKTFFPEVAKGKIEKDIDNKKMTIIINGAYTKLSKKSGSILSNLNFVYDKSVDKILVRKKRGIKYEN
jgi:predicted MPP superfamily phosphohydrolase